MPAIDVLLKRFEVPDEVRLFNNGRYDLVKLGGVVIGRATYEPGWKWSVDVAPIAGTAKCSLPHVGMVITGHLVVEFDDGSLVDLTTGTLFETPARPHDSWVVGDDKYVSLHFLDPAAYAAGS